MRSLRSRLSRLFALSLVACLGLALLLLRLTGLSSEAAEGRQDAELRRACELIQDGYSFYATGWSGLAPTDDEAVFRRDLADVVRQAMAPFSSVSGGIWQAGAGVLAYVAPANAALPATIGAAVAEAGAAATQNGLPAARTGGDLRVAACGLGGPVSNLAGFVIARVANAPAAGPLWLGLGVLLLLVTTMAAWLSRLVRAWGRHVRAIETALAGHEAGMLPRLAPTGERELDRIIAALNATSVRLEAARLETAELSARMAQSERLAALGRVAAGVAHEIRNPIASMRLKAEGALTGDEARMRRALEAVLIQVGRLERLASELLTMTQAHTPHPQSVELRAFLVSCAADHGARIRVTAPAMRVTLDPELIRRALDNLLRNAAALASEIAVTASVIGRELQITVADNGPGVPAELRDHLFEPFVTGRADGTGLGLPIARELIESHGGQLWLSDPGGQGNGAVFAMMLPLDGPWPES